MNPPTSRLWCNGYPRWKGIRRRSSNLRRCCELNHHDQKIRRTLMHDTRKQWTAVYIVISTTGDWNNDYRLLKLYNWASSQYRTQVTPNLLVMVTARRINVNVSCKLHLYSLQRTRSPPGPRLPRSDWKYAST